MRYAKWDIDFTINQNEGTVPPNFQGIFYTAPRSVAGYISIEEDISLLSQWGVVEITAEDFLALALIDNPLVTMADGILIIPREEDR